MFKIPRSAILGMLAGVASIWPHQAKASGAFAAPSMSGSASAPITATSYNVETYSLTQTDQDTYYDTTSGTTSLIPDTTCGVTPTILQSFQNPSSITAVMRSGGGTGGAYTWDVSGYAFPVNVQTIAHDTWKLNNNRQTTDAYYDDPLQVVQTVTLLPPKP